MNRPSFVDEDMNGFDRPENAKTWMYNRMIFLTRFDGTEVVVNCDLIVTVEKIPDTVLTLTTGDRIMVRESVEDVVERAVAFRHRALQGPGFRADTHDISAALSGPHRAPPSPGESPEQGRPQGQQKDS